MVTLCFVIFTCDDKPFSFAVSLNSVIAVLDADFHSLPSTQHRQQYGPVSHLPWFDLIVLVEACL